MLAFNLDTALADWRRTLQTEGPLEPGDLDELESGLLDRYDEFLLKGSTEAEAFRIAVGKTNAGPGATSKAFATATATGRSGAGLLGGYLTLAWRNLSARRWFNLLNFCCLTLGIITTALVVGYLNYETSYDDFLPEADNKYRLGMLLRSQGYSMRSFADFNSATAAEQQGSIEELAAVQGVKRAVQFMDFAAATRLRANDKELATENLLQTNTPDDFLAFFGWPMLLGNPAAFAAAPNTALLTESEAERFFGDDWRSTDLIGQALRIDTTDYSIAGVLADVPPNAHFDFSVALHRPQIEYWGARVYAELLPGEDPTEVGKRIDENMGTINTSLAGDELYGGTILQPVQSLHLGSDLLYEMKPPGDVRYLYIIGFIGLIILLLTISNYTNLSVAMNAGRAREIGMRKVFGATDGQIAGQFLLEAVVLSLLCVPVAAGLLWWWLPRFDVLMGTALQADAFSGLSTWGLLLVVSLMVGLLAGAYPAFILARTQVQRLFEGHTLRDAGQGIGGRKVLITAQFVLLIGLCSLTLFVNRQLNYLQTKDLGYVREGILYVSVNADSSRFATFRSEILRLPEVESVGSGTPMGAQSYNQTT
jgi:putative ABC transport system permease protein